MLRLAWLALPLALYCGCPISDAEAALNKCTDGKHITYTTDPCEKTGLSSAGPIKDATTVMPHFKPRGDSAQQSTKASADNNSNPKDANSDADVRREATIKPASPLTEKMLER